MKYFTLHRIAAYVAALGFCGHTFGGTLGTARQGPQAGPDADAVLASMRAVHFVWQGTETSWFDFWMGNALGVSALMLLAIVVLWVLGGLAEDQRRTMLPVAWSLALTFVLLGANGFVYFGPIVGGAFSTIALLTMIAATRWTRLMLVSTR